MEERNADLIGYEFPAQLKRYSGMQQVRVVGSWPVNETYVLCEVIGTDRESLIRPAAVVRARKMSESVAA